MNRTISTIVFLLVLMNIPISFAAPVNLLANPGFESGTTQPFNWNLVTTGSNTPIWDTLSHTGTRSIKINNPGTTNSKSGYPQSDLMTAVSQQNYTFSAWVKTLNAGGASSPAVRVVELDSNKNWIRQTTLYFNRGTNDWANKQTTFKTATSTKYLYVYANIWKGYGTFWVDDVVLSVLDTTIPVIQKVTLNTNTLNTGEDILVTVDATDNVAVTGVEANGISLTLQGGNIWAGTITSLEGTHSVDVSAMDEAGNIAVDKSTTYTAITPDTTLPIINKVTLNTNTLNTGEDILITVDATDNVAVTGVEANGISLTLQGGNIWAGTITSLEGTHSVDVSAMDEAGNIAVDKSTTYTAITPDTTLPIINKVTLNTNTLNTGENILVTVDATDNFAVTGVEANGILLTLQGGNIWAGTITSLEGTHSVYVSAMDEAGNIAVDDSSTYTAITPHILRSILANTGFESGTIQPLNWDLVTVDGNTPIWDTLSHTGTRSIKINNPGTTNSKSGYPQSDLMTAVSQQNYTFSAWVKTLNAGGASSPAVRVVELDSNKNWIRQTTLYFNRGTNDWTNKQTTFKTAINTKYLYVYSNIWGGYGTFWVDDVVLSVSPQPVAYWNFDENTGTTAYDSSGNGNIGTISGTTWTEGKFGSGLQFDGINDYVEVPDSSSLDATTMTFIAWIKNSKSDSQIAADRIVSKKVNWDDADGWSIEINGLNNGGAGGAGGATVLGSSRIFTNAQVLSSWDNAWHHLAVIISGSNASIYLDGSLKGSNTITGLVENNVPLAIGRLQAGTNYFNGLIDEVKIYDVALSASEIAEDYQIGASSPTPDPIPIPDPSPTGNTYYVAKTGNDYNPGTEAQPWLTISKAANTMAEGDLVYVKEGTYNEQVRITKAGAPGKYITYAAYPGDENKVVIDGAGFNYQWESSFGSASAPVLIQASYIYITGFTVINSNGAGIKAVNGLTNITIYKNWVRNTATMCISFRGNFHGDHEIKNIIVDGNDVSRCIDISYGSQNIYGEFIELAGVDTFEIKNNKVHDWVGDPNRGGEGIDAVNSINGAIHHNEVYNVKLGIYIDAYQGQDENIDVYNNLVYDTAHSGIAVAAEEGSSLGGYIKNIRIFNNIVYNPGTVAFGLSSCCGDPSPITGITIHSNTFRGSVWIGHVKGINDIILRNNIANDIGVASDIPGGAVILQNNFKTNSQGSAGFVNEAGHDFHLRSTSPAKDAGTSVGVTSFDYDGKERPRGAGFDIGAYEY